MASERLIDAIKAIIRAQFPNHSYLGVFEYQVQSVDGTDTLDGSPVDTTVPLPALSKVPLRSGLAGEKVKALVGSRCLVMFVNGDPSRPIIVGVDPTPLTVDLDATLTVDIGKSATKVNLAGGVLPVARMGDMAGPFPIIATGVKVGV